MRKTVLALACVILAPMFLVGITTSAEYDPWSDLDADGDIDIFDVVKIAGSYGTTGDPGKNVNVTNWPTIQSTPSYKLLVLTKNITWSSQAGSAFVSGYCDGYSRMSILMRPSGMKMYGYEYDATVKLYAYNFGPDATLPLCYQPMPPEFLSIDIRNYATGYGFDHHGPAMLETAGPHFWLWFNVNVTFMYDGWVEMTFYVYLRNE